MVIIRPVRRILERRVRIIITSKYEGGGGGRQNTMYIYV